MFYYLKFYFGYNDIYIGFRNHHMGDVVWIIVFSQIWSLWMFSGTQALPENRGAYVRTQNWQVWFDRSYLWVPPVRLVWSMYTEYNLDFTVE
jgi:hypothetical protein